MAEPRPRRARDRRSPTRSSRRCDRVIAGEMNDQFVTDFIQGGAGTSTNMNANEVIANLALRALGHKKGEYQYVNPNDHVNFGQSTNDVYPTAFHLGADPAARELHGGAAPAAGGPLREGREFDRVLKMGRTHLQDAVPMSLGAEFHGWGTTIGEEVSASRRSGSCCSRVNLGAHRHRHHGNRRARLSRARDEAPVRHHRHQVHARRATWSRPRRTPGDYVLLSGVLKHTSAKLTKICNDIRMLASGPRCGFNEINLPQMQPGSSIMPGKVNPVIPEVVNQTGFLVIGLDLTVTLAASAGQLQLNVMEPVITFALFASIATMERAVDEPASELHRRHHRQRRAHARHGAQLAGHRDGAQARRSATSSAPRSPTRAYVTGKSLHDIVVKGSASSSTRRSGTRSSRSRTSSTRSSSSESRRVESSPRGDDDDDCDRAAVRASCWRPSGWARARAAWASACGARWVCWC